MAEFTFDIDLELKCTCVPGSENRFLLLTVEQLIVDRVGVVVDGVVDVGFVVLFLAVFDILDTITSPLAGPSPDKADQAAAQADQDEADDDKQDDEPPPACLVGVDRGRDLDLVDGRTNCALVDTDVRLGHVLNHEAFVVEDESAAEKSTKLKSTSFFPFLFQVLRTCRSLQ